MSELGKGKRFNEGKTRYDLVPAYAQEQYAKVLTAGADKYDDRNWEKGMPWSKVIASMERHLQAIKRGEDYDQESGILHSAHVMTNAAFLTEYYKTFPQGDDRPHCYLRNVKIGLDIDEVLADWVGAWTKKFSYGMPEFWRFSYENSNHFEELAESGDIEDFYLNIPVKTKPSDIPFEPHAYVTSRSIPDYITKSWLQNNGFATAPLYSVPFGQSKVDAVRESGVDIFIDDSFDNFVELNNAGICTLLWDAPHNRRYDVGHKRIKTMYEVL